MLRVDASHGKSVNKALKPNKRLWLRARGLGLLSSLRGGLGGFGFQALVGFTGGWGWRS